MQILFFNAYVCNITSSSVGHKDLRPSLPANIQDGYIITVGNAIDVTPVMQSWKPSQPSRPELQGPRDVGDTRTSLALYGPRGGPIRSGWGRKA